MIYKINSIALSRLTNAAHVAFMNNVKAYIDKQEAEILGIDTSTYQNFKSALAAEQDNVNKSRASMYTVLMNEFDEKRNKYFRCLHHKLLAVMYAAEESGLYADTLAGIDKDLISAYPLSICNARAQDKTSKIRGFVRDLEVDYEGILEDIGIVNDVAALKKANEDFEDAYLSRVTLRTINPETAVMRAATEDCYHQICFTVNYWANRDNLTGTEKATATVCKRFIEVINQLVKEFRQKINSNGDIINDDEDEGLTPDGLTPDPSLESEGSEMLSDDEA